MWERFERSLSGRGISPQSYLQMQGKAREEMVTELEADAERAPTARGDAGRGWPRPRRSRWDEDEMLEALGPGEDGESPERPPGTAARQRQGRRLLVEELRLRKGRRS